MCTRSRALLRMLRHALVSPISADWRARGSCLRPNSPPRFPTSVQHGTPSFHCRECQNNQWVDRRNRCSRQGSRLQMWAGGRRGAPRAHVGLFASSPSSFRTVWQSFVCVCVCVPPASSPNPHTRARRLSSGFSSPSRASRADPLAHQAMDFCVGLSRATRVAVPRAKRCLHSKTSFFDLGVPSLFTPPFGLPTASVNSGVGAPQCGSPRRAASRPPRV